MRKIDSRFMLLLILSGLLSLGFIGGSAINYQITKASVHREIIQKDLPLTMNNIYSDISAELNRPILVASSMASDTFLKDWVMSGEVDEQRVRKYLLEIKEKYGFFTSFFISAYSFHYYHYSGVHKKISPSDSHDVWYYTFIGSEKEFDLDVDTDEAGDNTLTVFVNYRVEDDQGRLLGVTGVGLKMDHLATLVSEYREQYGRDVFLADRDGLIQVHRNVELIETGTLDGLTGQPGIMNHLLDQASYPTDFSYTRNDDEILANVRYVDNLDWLLFVEQSETESLKEARMNFWRTVIIGLITSFVVIAVMLVTVSRFQVQLEKLAVSDALTGCANRRKLEEEFGRFFSRMERSKKPFSLIVMDLDGFKGVNDQLGHVAGDEVLKTIATMLAKEVRPTDILARWGGDEFALLTETPLSEAKMIAERIRLRVEAMRWTHGTDKGADPRNEVTVSLGIASAREGDDLSALLKRADTALYRCKKEGRNQVNFEL